MDWQCQCLSTPVPIVIVIPKAWGDASVWPLSGWMECFIMLNNKWRSIWLFYTIALHRQYTAAPALQIIAFNALIATSQRLRPAKVLLQQIDNGGPLKMLELVNKKIKKSVTLSTLHLIYACLFRIISTFIRGTRGLLIKTVEVFIGLSVTFSV